MGIKFQIIVFNIHSVFIRWTSFHLLGWHAQMKNDWLLSLQIHHCLFEVWEHVLSTLNQLKVTYHTAFALITNQRDPLLKLAFASLGSRVQLSVCGTALQRGVPFLRPIDVVVWWGQGWRWWVWDDLITKYNLLCNLGVPGKSTQSWVCRVNTYRDGLFRLFRSLEEDVNHFAWMETRSWAL
jgi:hypothetical protein